MKPSLRERFDAELELVLAELPDGIRRLLDQVPLHVEDYPSLEIMREKGLEYRDELCGLYTGIALTRRSIDDSGTPSDVITLYREGILAESRGDDGRVSRSELRRQIRITVLHEVGHHFGLNETDLEELGYG